MENRALLAPKHILLVEDNNQVAEGMICLLECIFPDGLHVTHTMTLEGAKHLAEKQKFDAIITDNNFPSKLHAQPSENGVGLIRHVRSGEWGTQNAQLPIMFQTGDDSHAALQKARQAGATLCISKADPLDKLEKFVQSVIDDQPQRKSPLR